MKYIVLSTASPKKLEAEVNEAISKGFSLVGGVAVSATFGGALIYAQAMIKEYT